MTSIQSPVHGWVCDGSGIKAGTLHELGDALSSLAPQGPIARIPRAKLFMLPLAVLVLRKHVLVMLPEF